MCGGVPSGGGKDGSVAAKQEQFPQWLQRGSQAVWTWLSCIPDLGPDIGCSSFFFFFYRPYSGSEVGACVA